MTPFRSLADDWEYYRTITLPADATAGEVAAHRRTFYAGISLMLARLQDARPGPERIHRYNRYVADCAAFTTAVLREMGDPP
jgi:hypothetical protein